MSNLTELDIRLIEALVKDPLESNKSLANQLGTSQANIARRINRLTEDRVLRATVQEEYEAAGLNFMAHLDVYVSQKHIRGVTNALCKFPQVVSCLLTAGTPEILCRIGAKNQKHFADFLNTEIASIKGIKRIETLTVLEVHKYNIWQARILD
ncbi:MAG: Lrp/AsnC family transcriptional regulator [Gammaproteobacteria bacterium]|nr:Lrp/AsnC family transcriptional regulator [Gammaproteobacteria bacterium]